MRLCCPKCCEGYNEDLSHCPKCGPINVGKTAAGAWCYDIDSTPRDNREVLIAYKLNGRIYIEVMAYDEVDGSWWNEDRVTFTDKPFAWALLNLPEFPK